MMEGLEHVSYEEKLRELGQRIWQVVAVKGTALSTPEASGVTQTPDSRRPSSMAAPLEPPLRPHEITEKICGKRAPTWEKPAIKYVCRYVFFPLYSRIFAKVCLSLFPTDLLECPTAAKYFSARLSLLIGVAGLACHYLICFKSSVSIQGLGRPGLLP